MSKIKSAVEIKVDSSKGVDKLLKGVDKVSQKDTINFIADIFMHEVNKYVPENTGALKQKGYVLRTYTPKRKPSWFKVTYRNTAKLPYVMYQYYGEVWGPNRAVFSQGPSRNGTAAVHTGWISPIHPKRKTNRVLGHPARHTIELRDGRIINITGYTMNKNAQARWLEYVRNTSTVWTPLRRKMLDEVKEFVKWGIHNG